MRRAVGLFVVLASLVVAGGAQAAVTTSSITTPSDPFFGIDNGQSITVSGTSNGNSSDAVDLVCYEDNGSTSSSAEVIASGVPVGSGGAFSTSVALSKFHNGPYTNYSPCRLRAVPAGVDPNTGLGSFSGPRFAVVTKSTETNGSAVYDFYVWAPQLTAGADYDSFGGCGLDDSYLFDATVFGQIDTVGFYCNDWADDPTESSPSRTAVLVDGHPAYAPAEADSINSGASGFEGLTINSITQDSSNGNVTIVETEPFVRCVGDPYPANDVNCTAFTPSGVQVKRTITQNDGGHIVYIRDAYSSTDGTAHSMNLLMENDQHFFQYINGRTTQDVQYEFPGQSSFSSYNAGQTVSVPAGAPASILIQDGATSDGTTTGGRGAITYAQSPSGQFAFGQNSACCSDFDAPNTVSVPSSGSAKIGYAYSTEFTLAAVQKDALVAQDSFAPPSLKITKPRNHSKVKSSVKSISVKGTASAGSGVKSVTVNGHKVKVSGGKFSTTVRLHTGRNTITVKLTSEAGKTVTKKVTVTRAKPAAKKKAKKKTTSPVFTG